MNRGRTFYREIVVLAIPIVLQNLITNSLGLLDTFMVGRLGEAEMAAVTLANIPIFVEQLMIFGFQSGSSVLISQFYGKEDYGSINQVLGIGVYVAGGLTILLGAVMFFFPVRFMSLFGNDAAVVALAARYVKIVAFATFFGGLSEVYIAAHRSMANPRLGLGILATAMVANTVLNYALIFGKLGAPAMGIEGAALATLLSRVLQLVIALVHAFVGKRFRIKLSLMLRPTGIMWWKFLRYATPVVLNETLWGLGTALYPTIMGHMEGSQAILAAYGISGNIEKVATVMVFAIAGTAAIIIGREIGAGWEKRSVYDIGLALDTLSFAAGQVVGLLLIGCTFWFFSPVLYPMFNLSPEASRIATMMSVLTFVFLGVRAFNTTNIVGVLRGGGDVRAAAILDLGALWLVAIPLAALSGLVFQWGIFVVYLCIDLENVVKLFFGVHRLRSGKWIRDVTEE